MRFIFLFIFLAPLAWGVDCEQTQKITEYKPKHAKFFSISYYKGFKIVESKEDRIILVKNDLKCSTILPVIKIPVKRLVATSTTHLAFLRIFEMESSLVGFPGTRYIYDNKLRNSKLRNISYQLSGEELLALRPDLIIAYTANLSSEKKLSDLRKIGLPVVLNHDFEEAHPLGRAEWLVFSAAFVDKDEEGQKKFSEIVSNYNLIKKQTGDNGLRPLVLVGDIQNGKWATCGGKSDLAILIQDAGGALYLGSDVPETQFISLEKALTLQAEPSIWLTHNTWTSKDSAMKDSRYKKFLRARKYNNNKQVNAEGFNDFWEMGVARPDLLLRDLHNIMINSPDSKGLQWYKELQ